LGEAARGREERFLARLQAAGRVYSRRMRTAIEAIYENGMLRPLEPLDLAEHARVRVSVETVENDADRVAWLAQSERRLREVWENDADDVFNELLTQ
jgi:predicted DNA-binding antitoxin AbrB/MazE fold protein